MRSKFLAVVVALAMVFALGVGSAVAGPYVGLQVGVSAPVANNTKVEVPGGFAGVTNPGFNANVAAGVQAGYDWLGNKNYPNMKYFSVGVDYMYNGLFVNNAVTKTTGSQNTLSLLATAKLPMAVSKAFPNGRVFPYVSAGPSLNFTQLSSSNATNIGFLVEPGVKFKVTEKVDVSAAYRMNFTNVNLNTAATTKFQSTNNMAIMRVTYNF